MGDLEQTLPTDLTKLSLRSGDELVMPLEEAKRAIRIASHKGIAILGVEVIRILDKDFCVETYKGYEFKFDGNWQAHVQSNNDAALRFIDENTFGEGYGYILTSTSEREFKEL